MIYEDISEAEIAVDDQEQEMEVVASVSRTLVSPAPMDYQGFTFMNVNYELDPDTPLVDLVTPLSRADSMRSSPDDEARAASPQRTQSLQENIPIIRPSTPTEDAGTSDAIKAVVGDVVIPELTKANEIILEAIDRDEVISNIKAILEVKEKLRLKNEVLQNKLAEHFKRKRSDDTRDTEKSVADQEQRYANCMASLVELRKEYENINTSNSRIVNDYKIKLEERLGEAEARANEFAGFKRSTALSSENSRTGKSIPIKVLDQLEATEQRKESEVVAVRLENIKLRNKLRRHEQLLRQKEELADGLHLIDFEQLKIENQTYNEKIEERNEELLKLRKKITNIVQVLTHVKEKLQFVQGENSELKKQLRRLDDEVSTERDCLPTAKQERDGLRSENLSLRQHNGLLGNVPLLRDFEGKVDETEGLKNKIAELRSQHAELSAEILVVKRKIQRAQMTAL
ncbi:uncharacterized protein BJ171DRAFT_210604 [Polychytrium aggregatum]|uniref:uncharacterized protein n=1 Tax=Polychytrium aggregatum TaxID=110093 RepID=UPI0022FEDE03|nr:uncharacterized protein BJ171DRAFT_210604 [Polychytrium aggregatum]KAI9208579.1 hypothetical protein BJ171DRAFT_210604 [Polychytrium aggregatum]